VETPNDTLRRLLGQNKWLEGALSHPFKRWQTVDRKPKANLGALVRAWKGIRRLRAVRSLTGPRLPLGTNRRDTQLYWSPAIATTSMNLPKGFSELPSDQQTRIRESGRAIVGLAQQHAGGLIVAQPPSRGGIFSTASFFVLELNGRYWLGTAHHVLQAYEAAFANDPSVVIQVGDLQMHLDDRETYCDNVADACLIALAATEYPLLNVPALSTMAGWPPPVPHEGAYVALCGYPAIVRERPSAKKVGFNALSAIFRVTQASERHCSCQWEREEWLHFDGPPPPDPSPDLGGMSGGPVLLMGGIGFPLVGVISEFHASFEILRVGLFRPPIFGA
jgi:hypothetical protein